MRPSWISSRRTSIGGGTSSSAATRAAPRRRRVGRSELDPNSPEAHNLLGYVAALEGEGEEAIEAYRQAIALDDTYLEAMLNAAEVYIHPLGDFDQAIEMCDQALDLAEVDEEIIDALLLKFDALLGKGDTDEAARVVAKIPEGPYDNPNHTFLVGRALLRDWPNRSGGGAHRGGGDEGSAARRGALLPRPHPRRARRHARRDAGVPALARARPRDGHAALGACARGASSASAQKAVAALNPVLRRYVEGADVYVSDVPGMELVAEGVDPRALVLLDGLASEDRARATAAASAPCARVFVYALNVARLAGSAERHRAGDHACALEREITATFLEAEQAERPESELN